MILHIMAIIGALTLLSILTAPIFVTLYDAIKYGEWLDFFGCVLAYIIFVCIGAFFNAR